MRAADNIDNYKQIQRNQFNDDGMGRTRTECSETFILPLELPAKKLLHLPRKTLPRDTTY
jgi:hypothetical protein